jgi:hypothetical protein
VLHVLTHKDVPLLAPAEHARFLVLGGPRGAARRPDRDYDDTGDHISDRNPRYSELTGHYHLWKNGADPVVGICHYRRLFYDGRVRWPIERTVPLERVARFPFDYPRAERALASGACDAILPSPRVLVTKAGLKTIYGHFVHHKGSAPLDVLLEVVSSRDPVLGRAYERHVKTRRAGSYWNMLLARREVYADACAFVFPILFEVEARLDASPGGFPPRILGYLSESLFPFYLHARGYRVEHRNVLFVRGL